MIKYGKMKILKNKRKSKISIYEQVNIARKKFRLYNSYVFNVKFFENNLRFWFYQSILSICQNFGHDIVQRI